MFFTPPSCLWDREIAVDHRSLTGNGGGRRALLNKTGIAILREIEGGRREERAGAPKKIPPPSKKGGGGRKSSSISIPLPFSRCRLHFHK